MKIQISFIISVLVLGGCASTKVEREYNDLSLTNNELQSEKWKGLNRFPARYPEKATFGGVEGCATIEYVVTPQNEVKDIIVVAASKKYFANSAAKVVKNWKWSILPKNLTSEPIKTQTRFDFCLVQPDSLCKPNYSEYTCPSTDIIFSKGIKVG